MIMERSYLSSSPHDHAWRYARALGYTDAEIMAMDRWPWETWADPIPEITPAMIARAEGRRWNANVGPRTRHHFNRETEVAMYGDEYGRFQVAPPAPVHRERTLRTKEIAAQLRAQIAEAQKALALLDKTPGEPAEKMTTFGVSFPDSDQVYTYVAMRINGKWRVTGRHFVNGKYEWHEIFERFDAIRAKVLFMSTPVQFRSEDIER
jgi:hypothetical protein